MRAPNGFLFHPGHFIVVFGYSAKDKVIFYHNPSYKQSKLSLLFLKYFDLNICIYHMNQSFLKK